MVNHSRTFRLSDVAIQILDKQANKTQFVNEAIINTQIVPDDMKRCYKCDTVLPLLCFDKDRSKGKGKGGLCRNCKTIKNEYYRNKGNASE